MADQSRASSSSNTQSQSSSNTQSRSSSDFLSVEESLNELMEIDGALGAAIVDYESGMTLGTVGGRNLDMELAGSGTTEVVRSERNIVNDLGLQERIEDILISLNHQYHLVRMCERHADVFIYLVIDRENGNLGLARRQIDQIDERLELT